MSDPASSILRKRIEKLIKERGDLAEELGLVTEQRDRLADKLSIANAELAALKPAPASTPKIGKGER